MVFAGKGLIITGNTPWQELLQAGKGKKNA
jgi:hypothetical protein